MWYSVEPPIEERVDVGLAQLMALLANINRDAKKRQEPFSAVDFLPTYWKKPEPTALEPENDGMAPEKILRLIDDLMDHQERRKRVEMIRERVSKKPSQRPSQ